MCTMLHTKTGTIYTIGELAKIMPVLIPHHAYKLIPNDHTSCLCPIDMEATAKANNLSVIYHHGDYTLKEKEVIP